MVAAPPKVFLLFNDVQFTLKNRTVLKGFIENIFKSENQELAQLNCIFCTDDFLLNINQQYLKHNYYTDIITFDLSEAKGRESKHRAQIPIVGELYISIDRIKENAAFLKVLQAEELYRVIFHGILHLCGYNDKSPKDVSLIRKKEQFYLQKFLTLTRLKDVPRGTSFKSFT